MTPDVRDVLVRHEDDRWWIDNGFGVNVLKRYFECRGDAVRLARMAVSPLGGRVLVEDDEGWVLDETPRAAVRIGVAGRPRLA